MERCDFPRCRNLEDFSYIGHNLCTVHWNELCEADSKTEKKLLKRIGLIRDKSGKVIPIEATN
jgi:hypothetical protein